MRDCRHDDVETSDARPFAHCVHPHACTPMAHGNVVYVERCRKCGAERSIAVNQSHEECGPWSD